MNSQEDALAQTRGLASLRGVTRRQVETACLRTAAAAFIAFNLGKHGIYRPLTIFGVDYDKHWYAARAVIEGRNNYIGETLWMGFNYPQWSALVTFWLGYFDIGTAQYVWKFMQLGFVIGCWWLAYRYFHPGYWPASAAARPAGNVRREVATAANEHWFLISATLITAFSPMGSSALFIGNIDSFNAFLVMAMFAALVTGRERQAGIYWAMLSLVKMMPAVLVIPALLWRRWRLLQGWFGFMVVYFFMLVFTGRLKYEWFFVHDMAPLVPHYWRGISISLVKGFVATFYPDRWEEEAFYNHAVRISVILMMAIYIALMVGVRRRNWSFERALESGILFIPLLSPLFEDHHTAWALPVFLLQIGRWLRGEMAPPFALLYAAGWSVICIEFFVTDLLANLGHWTHYTALDATVLLVVTAALEAAFGDRRTDNPRVPEGATS